MCSNCSGDYEDPEVTNEPDDLEPESPADASAYVQAIFEGFAVRQDWQAMIDDLNQKMAENLARLRAGNDSRAIAASNANSRMLMNAIKGHL